MRRGASLGTFIAASTACVLLTTPTTTEPCFTASCAYSTWNIRPWGELKLLACEFMGALGTRTRSLSRYRSYCGTL